MLLCSYVFNMLKNSIIKFICIVCGLCISIGCFSQRTITDFNQDWKFYLGDDSSAREGKYDDSHWRTLNLPHDWSIEGAFSKDYPTTVNQGALPAEIGWYRKTFTIPAFSKDKKIYVEFDGVYRNSEVWINDHYLGKRPNGYISFRYELTPYLNFGAHKNVIAVKVDNSAQPSSRWYTGSGIYRNVKLITTDGIAFYDQEAFIYIDSISNGSAFVNFNCAVIAGRQPTHKMDLVYEIRDADGKVVIRTRKPQFPMAIPNPKLWSPRRPYLYTGVVRISENKSVIDELKVRFGIRYFNFDSEKGFFLNGKSLKIHGVCMHHDLGALGAAVNKRAIQRQLEILKAMGCNAIRTAHNPPAPELLDLCDEMGFLVMDEAFDMWKKRKNRFDYNVDFNEWHKQDLEDMIKRDRNHPSIIMWSIGNEIREQFDSTGKTIAKELVDIVKSLDSTRPVTSALTENNPEKNFIYQSHALDLLGFNYKLQDYAELPKRFPGEKLIASETASALATRGHYDFPSDSNRIWPPDSKAFTAGNADHTVSAYDHVYAYWGASHEDSWKAVKKYDFIAGTFVWSGFDFLGEPVPYQWPSRSSYYGIVDLAGFPKDVYYMYQSEWTNKPVLHLFPHWNWEKGKVVDVWAYYNNADEVELFLNGKSLGKRRKHGDSLHVMWRVPFQPGTLKAVSTKNGNPVLTKEIQTAGQPAKIKLIADRKLINANGEDLSFVTVQILDANNNLVPYADNLVKFSITGEGFIAGVDNGDPTSMESFKASERKSFNGLCLAIIQSTMKKGKITVKAEAEGITGDTLDIKTK